MLCRHSKATVGYIVIAELKDKMKDVRGKGGDCGNKSFWRQTQVRVLTSLFIGAVV